MVQKSKYVIAINLSAKQVSKNTILVRQKKIKIQSYQFFLSMKPYKKIEDSNIPITIGYYPFQAKAHIPRLLCQYLHVKYKDAFFDPDQWSRFKENEAKDWIIKDLPYCKDGSYVVTGRTAIICYIIEKAGRGQLLGINLSDKIKINNLKVKQDLKNAILGLLCTNRTFNLQEQNKDIKETWRLKIEPILLQYESECPEQGWFYGYITLMDFVIYETLDLISIVFAMQVPKFRKLMKLKLRFSNISQIKAYENSQRAVKEYSPIQYFTRFKQQKIKKSKNNNEMDVE